MERATTIGELVASHRRRQGLSQVKLGQLLNRSESWVSQVERGVLQIDRVSVLMDLARVLEVAPAELLPGTLLADQERQEHPAVTGTRRLLSSYSTLGAALRPHSDGDVASVDEAVPVQVWELVHGSRYEELATQLQTVLPQLEEAVHTSTGSAHQSSARLLAETYHGVAAMLSKLGQPDLAWIAADRAVGIAEQVSMPDLAAAGAFRLAHVFLAARQPELARQVAETALDGLTPSVSEASAPELISVWGALNLVAAIVAARDDRRDVALDWLRQAERAARWLGHDRDDYYTEFGPTNVALHAVAVAVEIGDAGDALQKAAAVDASHLSPERRARFLIDVARAHHQRRQGDEVLALLQEAERLTPEQVRTHHLVHGMVRDLLRDETRPVTKELRGLAQRLGILG